MELIEFIIKAKLSGYATGGESREKTFDDGSRGFEFESGGYRYQDRYYGFNPFSGTEHVYDAKGDLRYENRQNGTPEIFHGIESIDEAGKRVYVLYYHGGKMMGI